jgi:hypothetical protein
MSSPLSIIFALQALFGESCWLLGVVLHVHDLGDDYHGRQKSDITTSMNE